MPYIEAGWKYPSSLLLQYEDVKVEPRRGILAIADFLQVGIDEAAVVSILSLIHISEPTRPY